MGRERILVVDDEAGVRQTLKEILEDEGFEVGLAGGGEEALRSLAAEPPAVVLLDIWMPGRDGLALLPEMRRQAPEAVFVMISGHGTVETAIRATRLGAFDFVEKPLSLEKILVTVQNAIQRGRLLEKQRILSRQLAGDEELIGECEPIRKLRAQILRASASDARVLIFGENGTGKELVARMIHRHSPRRHEAFIEVNCAAIPEELIESELFGHVKGAFTGATAGKKGKFDLAHEGTLLLDEVGDMSMKVQAKVLRALQEQTFEPVGGSRQVRVDVRVLAATNKNLEQEIVSGRFREDLYFRLNVIPLDVPPLRERGEDILLLADHLARGFASRYGKACKRFTPRARSALQAYRWPGNVRELRNIVERLAILTDNETIDLEDLPGVIRGERGAAAFETPDYPSLREGREDFERRFILKKIRQADGNVSRTADLLGLERSSLYRKMKQYGIRPDGLVEKVITRED
ncbi:MAG: sigma-54-dependent transcriptional regulator [Acidobacteriota bacterium]